MSETQQERVAGLAGLIEEWRKTHLNLSANEDCVYEICADELDPFVERLKGLEASWRQRAGGRTWSSPEPMISDAERKCADELHALIYGEQPPEGRET